MILFKRNKDKDADYSSSYWCAKTKVRVGYDVLNCTEDEQVKAAEKDGYVQDVTELLNVSKNHKKRNTKPSTKSSEGGDIEPTS